VSSELVSVGVWAAGVVTGAFYWPHCARPALLLAGAYRRTLAVVIVVGLLALVTSGLLVLIQATETDVPSGVSILLRITTILAGSWYLAAWPLPDLVARFSGGRDLLKSLHFTVWLLGARLWQVRRSPKDDQIRKQAISLRKRLSQFPRSSNTDEFIELWLQEASVELDGADPAQPADARHDAIRDRARLLWPSPEDSKVAAILDPPTQ
jgi:hypothetical protein